MFGFIIGTACLIGLVRTLRFARHGHHGHHYGYSQCGGGHGCHSYGSRNWGRHGGPPWARGFEHDSGHGFGNPYAYGPRGNGSRGGWMMRALSMRLDATPGQEKVIAEAIGEMKTAMRDAAKNFNTSRQQVGRSVRGESFDESAIGESFAKQDEAIEAVRKAAIGALAKVHDALDARQREILADMIQQGGFGAFGGRFGGPFRTPGNASDTDGPSYL